MRPHWKHAFQTDKIHADLADNGAGGRSIARNPKISGVAHNHQHTICVHASHARRVVRAMVHNEVRCRVFNTLTIAHSEAQPPFRGFDENITLKYEGSRLQTMQKTVCCRPFAARVACCGNLSP